MNIYIVEADFGQWEDAYQVVLGVFRKKRRAEKIKSDFERRMQTLNKFWDNDPDNTFDENGFQFRDFNFCTSKEYKLQ